MSFDKNPEFFTRFIGLVQQVKSANLQIKLDNDQVEIFVGGERRMVSPVKTFIGMDVNDILTIIGEQNESDK